MKSKSSINKRRKKDVKLEGENQKFNYDYTVILNSNAITTITLKKQMLKLQIQSSISSRLTSSEQLKI
jgi:dGTP triphosphohydrolase